ncbi:MAG: peptidoglycan DD-metalloendopeptidase family protein [Propionicimonas sp.]
MVARRMVAVGVATVSCWVLLAPAAQALTGVLPVPGPVVVAFDPPAQPWLSGHRGVDLVAEPGSAVRASAVGRVVFAGQVGGKPVVVVSHGELRTTYEPVRAAIGVGAQVRVGEPVGTLVAGHSCPGGNCLHWGLKRGEEYLDPLGLLDAAQLRLLPADAAALAQALATARDVALSAGQGIAGVLSRPVPGGISSAFGRRLHPIFHEWRMHEGVDLSAGCGTAIQAAAPGTVLSASFDSSGGHRLIIDHGMVGGHRLTSSYLHAQGYLVHAGQRVFRGQVVGTVGSTGWSTGCHLHFSVKVDGRHVDPAGFL